jgi:hypothetical protein
MRLADHRQALNQTQPPIRKRTRQPVRPHKQPQHIPTIPPDKRVTQHQPQHHIPLNPTIPAKLKPLGQNITNRTHISNHTQIIRSRNDPAQPKSPHTIDNPIRRLIPLATNT